MDWQHRIADVIVEAERACPTKHLISQNIANGAAKVENPHPAVSIFNFHYATPPDAVAMNYGLNKVIGDNETGFRGERRRLPDGRLGVHPRRRRALQQPRLLVHRRARGRDVSVSGVRSRAAAARTLRRQLRILSDFIDGFDFVRMAPDNAIIKGGIPPGGAARALVERGRQSRSTCAGKSRPMQKMWRFPFRGNRYAAFTSICRMDSGGRNGSTR